MVRIADRVVFGVVAVALAFSGHATTNIRTLGTNCPAVVTGLAEKDDAPAVTGSGGV